MKVSEKEEPIDNNQSIVFKPKRKVDKSSFIAPILAVLFMTALFSFAIEFLALVFVYIVTMESDVKFDAYLNGWIPILIPLVVLIYFVYLSLSSKKEGDY